VFFIVLGVLTTVVVGVILLQDWLADQLPNSIGHFMLGGMFAIIAIGIVLLFLRRKGS